MSDPKADEFDKDYWFEMYQGQCATTDEWVKKYRDEVERKADATLLARCAELQRIAEVANAMVGKERDQVEAQAKRIAELEASVLKITADCNAVVCGKSDRITELEAEVARLRVDGERWQAFLNCGCVKLFGWAGVNNKPGEPSYNEVGYVHFGGEFWTNAFEEKYYSAADKAQAQEVLIAFADGAIKTAQLAAKESA